MDFTCRKTSPVVFLSHSCRVHPASIYNGSQRRRNNNFNVRVLFAWGPVSMEERFRDDQTYRQICHETEEDSYFSDNQSPEAGGLRGVQMSVQRTPHNSKPESTGYVSKECFFFQYYTNFFFFCIKICQKEE